MRLYYHIAFLLVCVLLWACKKDDPIPVVPEIEFLGVSPSTVTEYKDPIVFRFSYRDGDGDLGENDPDVTNCFLTDSRNGIVYNYRIKQLAPSAEIVSIQGELTITLQNTGITDGSSSQSATYSIIMQDRAGNRSNRIFSTPVIIVK